MCGETKGSTRSMKRSRWMTTAIFVATAIFIESKSAVGFSPDSPKINAERRKIKVSDGKERNRRNVDLNVAISSSGIYGTWPEMLTDENRRTLDISSLPKSSRSVAVGKIRNARIQTFDSQEIIRAGISSKILPREREDDFLSKDEERTLTHNIRSLRRAIRIRDEIASRSYDCIPTEADWADACNLSIIGLRRVMYEGQQARTALVAANAGLVTSIAKRHYRALKQATEAGGGVGTILTMQDMIQEGNLGLMQAAERFEPERGWRFSTYATYWIKQRILRSISDSSRIIRLPSHVHAMLQKVNKARQDMITEIGRVPSVAELAHYMELSVEELTKLTNRARNVVSLESPLRSGGSLREDLRTIGDYVKSDSPTPDEDAQSQYLKDDIWTVINELKTHERDVVIHRFGLENGNPMSVTQTAKHLGITSDRVRLVEARALNKLRSPQRNYRLKEYVGGQSEEDVSAEEPEPSPEKMWFF